LEEIIMGIMEGVKAGLILGIIAWLLLDFFDKIS
jgi:hypothetical protein